MEATPHSTTPRTALQQPRTLRQACTYPAIGEQTAVPFLPTTPRRYRTNSEPCASSRSTSFRVLDSGPHPAPESHLSAPPQVPPGQLSVQQVQPL